MLGEWYSKWMYDWETRLTTRDTNRIVRPMDWGFDWLEQWGEHTGDDPLQSMIAINREIVANGEHFFGYETPTDFRLEKRHPQLFPTNVRPETLAQDAHLKAQADAGLLEKAQFLRFTSAVKTKYPENDIVNARWYPAPAHQDPRRPKQAIIVMPQWNADALSHNVLCDLFNKFGVSALRLSKPYHDIRRPAELERSDYAVSSNIGRTLEAVRQAVVDVRSCIDWLQSQGYEHFGVMGTSLGSEYAFLSAAFDPRLKVCAFNHASTSFGDVVWQGQSTRHIKAAFEQAGLSREEVTACFEAISPRNYMDRYASVRDRQTLVVYATYDLTFPLEFSLEVVRSFEERGIPHVAKVLPCGHYTVGEKPYAWLDGWYLGSFIHSAYKTLRER